MNTYGIQLYSLRDISKDDLRGTLKKVADMGYKTVEFAGFFENKAEDVKSWINEYGLTAIDELAKRTDILSDKLNAARGIKPKADAKKNLSIIAPTTVKTTVFTAIRPTVMSQMIAMTEKENLLCLRKRNKRTNTNKPSERTKIYIR